MRRTITKAAAAFVAAIILAAALIPGAAAAYTVNGVTLPLPGYEEGAYSNNCRTFAGMVYEELWGETLTSYRGTADDMLRDVPEGEARLITAENAREYISAAAPGAAIRITDDIEGNDSQGTRMHSQILAWKDEDGFTVYEGNIASAVRLKYFTWEEYAQSWSKYGYFKYIKWPGAAAWGGADEPVDEPVELPVEPDSAPGSGGWEILSFEDVPQDAWYCGIVGWTTGAGFVSGRGDGRFEPQGLLTWAEAVKLAACIHQWYWSGSAALRPAAGENWWSAYEAYALEKGLIAAAPADWNAAISRRDFAAVLYRAMPEGEYRAINSVADGAIPDVAPGAGQGDVIYAMYRAGVLTGDADGAFRPGDSIIRCEVAAVIYRMAEKNARVSFTLG